MRLSVFWLLVLLLISTSLGGAAIADETSARLIMPDGQLRSHPVEVRLPGTKITSDMEPKLRLVQVGRASDGLESDVWPHGGEYSPFVVAPDQTWHDEIQPDLVQTGTVLLFNLRNFPIPCYKTGTRVQPVLRWHSTDETEATDDKKDPGGEMDGTDSEPRSEFQAIGARVYLSSGWNSIGWTLFIVVSLLFLVWCLRRKQGGLLGLVTSKEGELSMSLTQMALWTLAVGSVVLGFGLMRLSIPDIPDNLVLLMGGAATTAAVGHWQMYRGREAREKKEEETLAGGNPNDSVSEGEGVPRTFAQKLGGLLQNDVNGQPQPSLAKAQVLFWTLITLIVFVVKSVLDGQLWDVPTQLVLLMGISQASFLARTELAVRDDQKAASTPPKDEGTS